MRADLIVDNVRALTMESPADRTGAIAVWQGRIIALGDEARELDSIRRIDADGAVVVPGFYDAHNHMAAFGRMRGEIDASGFRAITELYDAIRERARTTAPDAWIIASGYDQKRLGGHPTREGLDAAGSGRPVLVNHRTTHMLVASTAVFDRLGATHPQFPTPPGGAIERDADGRPTGLVMEQAMTPFRNLVRPFSTAALSSDITRAGQIYLSEGITSVCEAGIGSSPIVGSSPVELAAYQSLRDSRTLPVRVQVMVAMENLHEVVSHPDDDYGLGLDLGLRTGLGDDWLSIGALKMFTDGALSSRTAALSTPFLDHGGTGVMQFDPEDIARTAVQAHRAGWQLAIHAIGDRAVDAALDAIERAKKAHPRPDARHRIEHASVVRPDQLSRFVGLGVTPSIQGRFVYELGDGIAAGLGPERVGWTYRHRSFRQAGLITAGGSDRPVAAGAPLVGMQSMVRRVTESGEEFSPREAVTAYEALCAYTTHAAYACRHETSRGRIRPGLLADLTFLDDDPTDVAADRIGAISVLATVIGGNVAFDQGLFNKE